ncbi:splicing factor, arginine/serine-rich 4/5/6 [Nematocida displodere]|uniref:Splicing factor, arginine/serine-rich 4/5/6 n=1 Tax=Nematocida displodere TaxID=1805483 RepID=A0A177EJA0_9MICR|nr:splicing factor, arginine/serine-rich 4/5/6 [Nematocida displodere]
MQLYIGGIGRHTEESQVFQYFSQFGQIDGVKLYKSYGFLTADQEVGERILREKHTLGEVELVVEEAKGRKQERIVYQGDYPYPPRRMAKPFRLILEKLPRDVEWRELRSFVLSTGAKPDFLKILPSGDGMLEFVYRQDRDVAIDKLNHQSFNGEEVSARLGRKKVESVEPPVNE